MAVYLVTRDGADEGEKPRMIEARTASSAIAYAARSTFAAQALSLKEAVAWSKRDIEIEEVGAEAE